MGRRKRFSREYKLEAVRLASQPDSGSVAQVSRDLGLKAETLRRWIRQYRDEGAAAFPGHGNPRDEELARLRRELAKVKRERDFLKEAAAFFAKEST
jgi:transposase